MQRFNESDTLSLESRTEIIRVAEFASAYCT
jgi:hypothetical protein